MRDQKWLQQCLDKLLENHFSDVERANLISISFGRKAKRRFGSIKMSKDRRESRITINGVFRDYRVPEQIIYATIAHELCHYTHGFCSPLKQKYRHPHKGGVIMLEMKKRDLGALYEFEKRWTKSNWSKFLLESFPQSRRRVVRTKSLSQYILDVLKP